MNLAFALELDSAFLRPITQLLVHMPRRLSLSKEMLDARLSFAGIAHEFA